MNIGGYAGSTEQSKRFHRRYRRKETLPKLISGGHHRARKETSCRSQSVVTWMRSHTKSKLRDKTPRGKQLVHALTQLGITLWQKTGASAAIARLPGLAAVLSIEYSCRGKCNMIFLGTVWGSNTASGTKFGLGRLFIRLPGGCGSPKISRALQTANPAGETCAAGRTLRATLRLRGTRFGPHPP